MKPLIMLEIKIVVNLECGMFAKFWCQWTLTSLFFQEWIVAIFLSGTFLFVVIMSPLLDQSSVSIFFCFMISPLSFIVQEQIRFWQIELNSLFTYSLLLGVKQRVVSILPDLQSLLNFVFQFNLFVKTHLNDNSLIIININVF